MHLTDMNATQMKAAESYGGAPPTPDDSADKMMAFWDHMKRFQLGENKANDKMRERVLTFAFEADKYGYFN